MSSLLKNLSEHESEKIPSAKGLTFNLCVSEWNREITGSLEKAAYETLVKYGASEKDISTVYVPGSFELSSGARLLSENKPDAIICIGCVIKGETPHFDYICQAIAMGITQVSISHNVPVIFGVLTTNDHQQAVDRSGGKQGNKGVEAAITAIKMATLFKKTLK